MSNSYCCCSLFQEVQKKPAAVSSGKIVQLVETYDDVSAFMMHCCRLCVLDVINPVNCYIFTVSFCFQQKKQKVKLSRGPETLSADRIPHTTVGPLGLETDGRDVMSDGSSEGSSQADETLFCGISTCARLCEALPPEELDAEPIAASASTSASASAVQRPATSDTTRSAPALRLN